LPRLVAVVLALLPLLLFAAPAAAQNDFVVRSFGASYHIRPDGSIDVIEDILVDFGSNQHHGITRSLHVAFPYDDKHDREYRINVISVTDGQNPWRYSARRQGADLVLKIGDPDKLIRGEQRYVISYTLQGALNSFPDHDELYWEVTGHDTGVPIERASAVVEAPSVTRVACYEGPVGSTDPCESGLSPNSARFSTRKGLGPNEGLTIVVGLGQGTVNVGPPLLVTRKTLWERTRDFLGLSPGPIIAAVAVGIVALAGLLRLWWVRGRDRWYGDVQYLTGSKEERGLPLTGGETVVVEYAPPEVGEPKRPLRPAEIGVLMDERADTLDVSATIVDLAVRGYLRIIETEKGQHTLQRLKAPDAALLEYESSLLAALFEDADAEGKVEMKDLKYKFADDLARVKKQLYKLAVTTDRMFPSNPETVKVLYGIGGLLLAAAGAGLTFLLGLAGAGIVGIPVILAGVLLVFLSPAMPRRTASGRELYRRARGFREFMEVAEKDRARFAEEVNLFEKYLPYAIVFRCTDKWARAFEGLARRPDTTSWYASPYPFAIASFSHSVDGFSSSVSRVMASTQSSSGGSGFGGGFSGGGGGGGGVGSW
jgi:uncharacterized protein (TIGR04222 family)